LHQTGGLHRFPSEYERTASFDGTTKQTLSWEWTAPHKTTFAGPAKLKLWVDPLAADDLDIHVFLKKIDHEGNIVEFAAHDSLKGEVARGWIGTSRRELDRTRCKPYRRILALREEQKLRPFEVVPVEIEITTFSVILKEGDKLRLKIAGTDLYETGPWGIHPQPRKHQHWIRWSTLRGQI
jgi:predicted acyl esterase